MRNHDTTDEKASDFGTADCGEFEPSEYRARWKRLREYAEAECDVVLVSSPENLRYFCGYRSLLTRSKWRPIVLAIPVSSDTTPVLLVPGQEVGIAKAYTPIEELVIAQESNEYGHDDPIAVLVAALKRHGWDRGRAGMEFGFGQRIGMTITELRALEAGLGSLEFVDAHAAISDTRARKSFREVERLRRACEISCDGVRAGFEELRAGMTEVDLHRLMTQQMVDDGADEVWLAVGSGSKGYGVFNALPTDVVLREGDLVWVDGGAMYGGYVCDFIRTAVIGGPSQEQTRWYSAAYESNRAALTEVRPGISSAELFACAMDYLKSIGMPDAWRFDVLGHGLGLEIHELPGLTADSAARLEPGHVVTIEPSLSPPGHGHGHYILEEVVAVTEDGQDLLTSKLPGDLWIA